MDVRGHVEKAIELSESEKPTFARALRELLPMLDAETPASTTPIEVLDEVSLLVDTMREDINSQRMHAGLPYDESERSAVFD